MVMIMIKCEVSIKQCIWQSDMSFVTHIYKDNLIYITSELMMMMMIMMVKGEISIK